MWPIRPARKRAAGVEEALALLRSRDVAVIAGAAGYMLFDVAMLGVCFAAFGLAVPPLGVLLMAYLIGQLGGLIPLPGGLGGVDGGLIGTLVLYGAGATAKTPMSARPAAMRPNVHSGQPSSRPWTRG